MPDFSIEKKLPVRDFVFGLDEAGRGPWCGPVVAACVCFPAELYELSGSCTLFESARACGVHIEQSRFCPGTQNNQPMQSKDGFGLEKLFAELNDSKKLSAKKREKLFPLIMQSGAIVGIGQASAEEIDEINILQASFLAMHRALEQVRANGITPAFALIDGNRMPAWEMPCKTVVGGDALSLSIAAASIIAKVTRDRLMADLAKEFPAYGWERNAGYGTADHIAALKTYGVTIHHRKSYAPIKTLLSNS